MIPIRHEREWPSPDGPLHTIDLFRPPKARFRFQEVLTPAWNIAPFKCLFRVMPVWGIFHMGSARVAKHAVISQLAIGKCKNRAFSCKTRWCTMIRLNKAKLLDLLFNVQQQTNFKISTIIWHFFTTKFKKKSFATWRHQIHIFFSLKAALHLKTLKIKILTKYNNMQHLELVAERQINLRGC